MSAMNITYDAWCAGSKLSREEHLSLMLQTCYKLELENAGIRNENESLASMIRGLEMELDRLERERTQWLCTCGGTKPNA